MQNVFYAIFVHTMACTKRKKRRRNAVPGENRSRIISVCQSGAFVFMSLLHAVFLINEG